MFNYDEFFDNFSEVYKENAVSVIDSLNEEKRKNIEALQESKKYYREMVDKQHKLVNEIENKKHVIQDIMSTRVDRLLIRLQEYNNVYDTELKHRQEDINTFTACLNSYSKQIEDMKKMPVRIWSEEDLRKGMEKIANHPLFQNALFDKVQGEAINIVTEPIRMFEEYTDRIYLLGRMEITIPMKKDESITFYNLSNKRTGYDGSNMNHPHIFSGGHACFGGYAQRLASYIDDGDLYALYCTLIEFLQDVDIEDAAGVYVCAWDEIDEDGNIIREGHQPVPDEYNGYGYALDEYTTCQDCGRDIRDDETIYCYHCDEPFCEDCITYIPKEDKNVCNRCLENHYYMCDDCDEYVRKDETYYITDEDKYICEDCYNDGDYFRCEACDEYYSGDMLVELEDVKVCKYCYNKRKEHEDEHDF